VTKLTDFYPLSAYWNPMNFIPFSFAVILLKRYYVYITEKRVWIVLITTSISLVFALVEWNIETGEIFLPGQGYAIPAYTRVSLVFSVISICVIALHPAIRTTKIVRFMSRYSLALYCLHPFCIQPVKKIISMFLSPSTFSLLSEIALVILCSYAISPLLKIFLRQEVIQ
jgi:hypothetical protein